MGRIPDFLKPSSSAKSDPDGPPPYGESSAHPTVEKAPVLSPAAIAGSSSSAAGPGIALGAGAKRACVMLNRMDLLQLVGFAPDVIQRLDVVIRQTWDKGVQKHKFEDGCWEWKLSGRPCKSAQRDPDG